MSSVNRPWWRHQRRSATSRLGGAVARAREHAVAAPGQAPAEPAKRLVVELAHRGFGDALHLPGGDARAVALQQFRRDLCLRERFGGAQAALRVGQRDRAHEGDGRGGDGGFGWEPVGRWNRRRRIRQKLASPGRILAIDAQSPTGSWAAGARGLGWS